MDKVEEYKERAEEIVKTTLQREPVVEGSREIYTVCRTYENGPSLEKEISNLLDEEYMYEEDIDDFCVALMEAVERVTRKMTSKQVTVGYHTDKLVIVLF